MFSVVNVDSIEFKEWENKLYRLPGFPDGKIPEKIVVTDHAIEVFKQALPKQGMAGLAWLGKDEENRDVLYLDLIPAFNANDNKPRTDKNEKKYEEGEYVDSLDQPLGGLTGIVHSEFIRIKKNHIEKAIESNDRKSLLMYSNFISENKIEINPIRMFGFGIFKGDKTLLEEFRRQSGIVNRVSIERNPEFYYANFFTPDEKLDEQYQREFYISRVIPLDIAAPIKNAFLKALPLDKLELERKCESDMQDLQHFTLRYDKEWLEIKDKPDKKIIPLFETLLKLYDLYELKTNNNEERKNIRQEHIPKVMACIIHNLSLMHPDRLLQQEEFKKLCINNKANPMISLVCASAIGDVKFINEILSKFNNDNNEEQYLIIHKFNFEVLRYAVSYNRSDVIRYLCEKFLVTLSNQACTFDLNKLLEVLNPPFRKEIFENNIKKYLISELNFISNAEDLSNILEFLDSSERAYVFEKIQNKIPDFIHSSNDFLKVFKFLEPDQRIVILNQLEINKIESFIVNSRDFKNIFELCDPARRSIIFTNKQHTLPELINDTHDLANILTYLDLDGVTAVLQNKNVQECMAHPYFFRNVKSLEVFESLNDAQLNILTTTIFNNQKILMRLLDIIATKKDVDRFSEYLKLNPTQVSYIINKILIHRLDNLDYENSTSQMFNSLDNEALKALKYSLAQGSTLASEYIKPLLKHTQVFQIIQNYLKEFSPDKTVEQFLEDQSLRPVIIHTSTPSRNVR